MSALAHFLRLLAGTVIYRPYVYAFFACYLVFALRQLRLRGTIAYTVLAYLVAFGAEYSATHDGFPFGRYVYVETTRVRELWVANVPFWDSLSFVFLSYFSWVVAGALRDGGTPRAALLPGTAVLGGFLMMLLDVVIDPLTLLGDRWFLGRIYYYPDGGTYFGVTLSNFAGWFFVGTVTIGLFQALLRWSGWAAELRRLSASEVRAAGGVYAGVFFFQLAILVWLQEWRLFAASAAVVAGTLGVCWRIGSCRLGATGEAVLP